MTIYFDHNATTPLDKNVLEAMLPFLQENYANPSSVYSQGRAVRAAVDNARQQVAELVNAHPTQVIFTSGGTEANNLAIQGAVRGMQLDAIATSAVEHPSVRDVAKYMSSSLQHTELEVDASGCVLTDSFNKVANNRNRQLFSIMLANNESGVIQDVAALANCVRANGQYFHTDAVQAVGKMPVDINSLNVNLMTLSSHKIYGPKGAGALVYDKSLDIEPVLYGGGQEKGLRSGTENVAAIVGFGKACELARQNQQKRAEYLKGLQQYFEEKLKQIPEIVVFAQHASRLPNTTFFSLPGIDGETLLMQLDLQGIAVSSGSACASKSLKPSHVLMAMCVEESIARSAIRVSFGAQNTREEIDNLVDILTINARMIASMHIVNS